MFLIKQHDDFVSECGSSKNDNKTPHKLFVELLNDQNEAHLSYIEDQSESILEKIFFWK